MPYLVRTGDNPWFQATNNALDQQIQVAAQDRARTLNEGVQIRAEDRGEQRQIAGEGRSDQRQQAGEGRSNAEWGRRFDIGQGAQIAGEQRGENRQIAGETRLQTRQDTLRNEGYARDAAGGNSLLDFAQMAGLIPKNPAIQPAMDRNAMPGPGQGALPVPQMFGAMMADAERRRVETAQRDEAGNIISANAGAGILPPQQMPDGAYGPAPLPRFNTPQAASGFVNNVQQQGQFNQTFEQSNKRLEAMVAAAQQRAQSTFNQGGARSAQTVFANDYAALTREETAIKGENGLAAAIGWVRSNYNVDTQQGKDAAIRDGVTDVNGNPIESAIRSKIAEQKKRMVDSINGNSFQNAPGNFPAPATIGGGQGRSQQDIEDDAMLDAMLRAGLGN